MGDSPHQETSARDPSTRCVFASSRLCGHPLADPASPQVLTRCTLRSSGPGPPLHSGNRPDLMASLYHLPHDSRICIPCCFSSTLQFKSPQASPTGSTTIPNSVRPKQKPQSLCSSFQQPAQAQPPRPDLKPSVDSFNGDFRVCLISYLVHKP